MSNLTKQLLNTVLQDVTDFYVSDSTVYLNRTDVISANHCTAFGNFGQSINIHELAHRCKEWAFNLDGMYIVTSQRYYHPKGNEWESNLSMEDGAWSHAYYADTEPGSVFKACQWILDQKDNT
jgi:hypothetical protein